MLHHRIPPAVFGCIQRSIRRFDQVHRRLRVAGGGAGDADGDGDGLIDAGSVRHAEVLDCGADHFAGGKRTGGVEIRQQQAEFLAAIAAGKAVRCIRDAVARAVPKEFLNPGQ